MKRFKHLLVHLDLEGNHDAAAIRYAAAVGRLSQSRSLEFVHTLPAGTFGAGWFEDPSGRTVTNLPQAQEAVERLVRRHLRTVPGCRIKTRALADMSFAGLLSQLRHGRTDLILVGRSDTNGAFVERLVRKAPCSVMVIPAGSSSAYRRILVTTDFSKHSAQALDVAAAFARARKLKRLRCLHCYQIPYGHHKAAMPVEQFRREAEVWAHEEYQQFLRMTDLGGVEAQFVCEQGPIAALAILHQAVRSKSDLLIMGARGKDALAAALLGSTTAQVVRETPIPALVVKDPRAGRSLLDFLFGDAET